MSKEKDKLKIVTTDIRKGTCDVCLLEDVVQEAKIEKYSGLLCGGCLQAQWDRRKALREEAKRPLLKGAANDDREGGRKSA